MKTMNLIAILGLLGILVAPGARGAEWESIQVEVPALGVDAILGVSGRPAVVDAEGRIHLVFQNNLELDLFRVGHVSRSPEGGWGEPEVISQPGRSALNPTAALDRDGRMHVLWEDVTNGDGDIVHRYLTPGGAWSDPITVAPAPGISSQPRLAVDAFNHLHAVWVDNRAGYRAILYSTAPVGGAWEPAIALTDEDDIPDEAVITADGLGGVHALWRQQEGSAGTGFFYELIYVYIDGTQTEPPQPVVLVSHPSISHQPYLAAAENGTVHLVWMDNRNSLGGSYFEIFYKRLLHGVGWGYDKRFTYEDTEHARPVAVAGPGGSVNIAWEDYRDGNPRVYHRQITPEFGWDPSPTQVSAGSLGSAQTPTLVVLPDHRVVVLWTDASASGTTRILAKDGVLYDTP